MSAPNTPSRGQTSALMTAIPDEDADVVLRSADGGCIRVHSFHLMAASPVFRDMFKLPILDPSEDIVPISLPENKDQLNALKFAMYLTRKEAIRAIYRLDMLRTYSEAIALYEMGIKYQLDKCLEVFSGIVELRVHSYVAFEAFCWASYRGDNRVAVKAIQFFPQHGVWPPNAEYPVPWFLSAEGVALAGERGHAGLLGAMQKAHASGMRTWEGVAHYFAFPERK